jgi:phosphoribosylformimino-5-aminoimidazole carboxamide ribotide isomerase
MEDLPWFQKLVEDSAFRQRIVLALDGKDGIVATRGWTASSNRRAADVAKQVSGWSLAGILYTDVAKDGMMSGPNYEQTSAIVQATDIPVIASGGVGSIEHIRKLVQTGAWGTIIGRSLYEGAVDLREAITAASR